ncbi:MAG: NADP-dependent 3-hydroxy acid dehydrogenase YdfG [Neolewinella sp.]|jgi:NADP-dependent 3-hydroxy acid dehydrogenase YdfG/Tfp pilus assembly protein PilF
MLSITLAYTTDNQTTAHRIAGALSSHVEFTHVFVGKANEGPVLADLLKTVSTPVIILMSDNFLTNPNCMLRGHEIFGDNKLQILPVFIRSHQYDELEDELVTMQTSLSNQAEVMHYVNHWQDRYIDLRAQAEELSATGGESFQSYMRKIRETSTEAEELLFAIKETWSVTETQFAANNYHQLFIFTDRPNLWEDFKTFEETPIDVSGIPGLGMLGSEVDFTSLLPSEMGDGAQVQGELEEHEDDLEFDLDGGLPDLTAAVLPLSDDAEILPIGGANNENPVVTQTENMSPEEQAASWVSRAWTMFDANDGAAGLDLLSAGREALPDHPVLHYNYALLLATATEDISTARQETEELLDKFPEHGDALFLNGELAEAAGDIAAARENWEQLSDQQPFFPDLNYRLGTLINSNFPEDYLDAAAYLRRATKDDDVSGDTHYRYALLLAGPIGRKKKALKQLRKAVELDPRHAAAHFELATLLHGREDFAGARNAFLTAVSLEAVYNTPENQLVYSDKPVQQFVENTTVEATEPLKQDIAALEAKLAEQEALLLQLTSAPAPAAPPAPIKATPKGDGKTVFISGATSGIGRATARRLAADGFRLILLGRRKERLAEVAAELHDNHGTECHLIIADVRHRKAIHDAVQALPPAWSNIDVLFNNAGKAKGFDPINTGNYDHWDEMIDVNLKGLLTLTREVSPLMVARQSGTIINVCSTAGKEVYPNGNVYCATKHAVDALTYAMRLDLVKHGIRVGQICPAHVEETEFAVVRFDGDAERAKIYNDFQPLRSRDVAEAVHFMITQPRHVNIMDVVLQGTQQASSTVVDRSGRAKFAPEEE